MHGDFGPGTEEAVAAFNKCHGLSGSAATADMQAIVYSNAAIPFTESGEELLLALESIADGVYTGTLSGDSYTTTDNPDKYTITPDIAPAEMTIIIQGGQVQLYCAASATASGAVFGVETPRSPTYTQTVAGSLPLRQVGTTLVRAEGDLTAPGEGVWVNWDKNGKFTKWDVEPRDCTYHCTVSVTMINGVPVAEVVVAGSASHRACAIPLSLRTSGAQEPASAEGGQASATKPMPDEEVSIGLSPFAQQPAEASNVLWTNANASAVKNDARDYYVMFELPDCTVTGLETRHDLSDGKEPGQIMLFAEDGSEYGPFDATGRDGQDGVKNAYWVASVSIDLPAGRYAIADSDQATWSNNGETDGWGMATVYGIRKEQAGATVRQVENVDIPVVLSWSVGNIRYSGAIDESEQPHGYGTGDMEADADGESWLYEGMWAHGHLCGEGTITFYTDNYTQSGTFLNDYLDGYGSQTVNGVLRYEGQWRQGNMHGYGKIYTKTGVLLYEGEIDQNRRGETPSEAKSRTAAFWNECAVMDKAFYAKWKAGNDVTDAKLSVSGSVLALSEQSDKGTFLIDLNGDSDKIVALTYRYAVGEEAIAKGDRISAWGYCVGSFTYNVGEGKTADAPLIEVVYLTTK